jgi:hypothetical protein
MRLRFTIRDLLWLTALVAVLVAWWADHRRATESYAELEKSAYVQNLHLTQDAYQAAKVKLEQMVEAQMATGNDNGSNYLQRVAPQK